MSYIKGLTDLRCRMISLSEVSLSFLYFTCSSDYVLYRQTHSFCCTFLSLNINKVDIYTLTLTSACLLWSLQSLMLS